LDSFIFIQAYLSYLDFFQDEYLRGLFLLEFLSPAILLLL